MRAPSKNWTALENPNPSAQRAGYSTGMWAYPTRQGKTARLIVVHDAESVADKVGPDLGAENVDRYMRTVSSRQVSWGATVDSDSVVWGCPWDWTCFHAGSGYNRISWGFEQAYQASKLRGLPSAWKRGLFRNAGKTIACASLKLNIPIVRVNRDGTGVVAHGTPKDATVPGISPGSVRWDPGNEADYDWDTVIAHATDYADKGVVTLGFANDEVGECQRWLVAEGYELTVDNSFGPSTHGALRHSQAERGQRVTGVWVARSVPVIVAPPPPAVPVDAELVKCRAQVKGLNIALTAVTGARDTALADLKDAKLELGAVKAERDANAFDLVTVGKAHALIRQAATVARAGLDQALGS